MKQGFIILHLLYHPYLPSTPQICYDFIFYDQGSSGDMLGPAHGVGKKHFVDETMQFKNSIWRVLDAELWNRHT
ncbi:unnamed protein product [Camellia sinensis]